MKQVGILFRDEEGYICLDLHSYRYVEAQQLLKRTLDSYNHGNELKVIHGYHRGNTLKELVWNFKHVKIADREHGENPGETIYFLD
jgi:hypothetical protein